MGWKVGDKVYCKKDIIDTDGQAAYFSDGKIYTITNFNDKFMEVMINGCFFYVDKDMQSENLYRFDDHFLTEKEMRKKKLLSLRK